MNAAGQPAGTDSDWPADAVEVGRIVDAWGLKGWVKVQPFAAEPQALFSSRRWFMRPADRAPGPPRNAAAAAAAAPPATSILRITQVREHGDGVVAQVQDVCDRNAAEALRGARLFVPRSSFPTAGADEFYWVDLIGLEVVNRAGKMLGTVVGLLDTGAQSVLRVGPTALDSGPPPDERLIPFVAAYVDEVSLEQRRIRVDWELDY